MSERVESRRGQGPVAVITLLFGLLLGFAGGTGVPLQADPAAAQLTFDESLRRSASLRTVRSGDERPDSDEATALLPTPPGVVTELLSLRPAAAASPSASSATLADRPVPYQARAPPAA